MTRSNFTESSPFLLLLLLGYCLAVTEGELRCYCNESSCVSTSYMCKSTIGQCYTSVEVRGEVTHQTHGCLDSLPEEHRASCRRGLDVISSSTSGKGGGGGGLVAPPLLLCCTEQMCNYIRDDYDISIILTPKYNGTLTRGNAPQSEDNAIYSKNHHDDRDLWFKAAVIAVPIAGGFILVLLVLLAVRMLRTDSRHHRRLLQVRRERSLTKAHMCITEYFVGKNSKQQQCSLFSEKPAKPPGPQLYSDLPGPVSESGSSGVAAHGPFSEAPGKHFSHVLHGGGDSLLDSPVNFASSARGGGGHHHVVSNGGVGSSYHHHSNSSLTCSSAACCHGADASGCSRTAPGSGVDAALARLHAGAPSSTNSVTKPCSFYAALDHSRSVSKGSCPGRDVVAVKMDRSGYVHPTVMVSSAGQCLQGHPYAALATWDKTYTKGSVPSVV